MSFSRFDIVAHADPQTLIRMLNYFAQLGLSPSRVNALDVGGSVTICIEQPGLDEQQARIIAERMRSSVLVETVRAHRGRHPLLPLSETIDVLSTQ